MGKLSVRDIDSKIDSFRVHRGGPSKYELRETAKAAIRSKFATYAGVGGVAYWAGGEDSLSSLANMFELDSIFNGIDFSQRASVSSISSKSTRTLQFFCHK